MRIGYFFPIPPFAIVRKPLRLDSLGGDLNPDHYFAEI